MTLPRTAPFRQFLPLFGAALLVAASVSEAAERVVLDAANFSQWAPAGKEADAIYGDLAIRNRHVAFVVAAPGVGRDANLTVRDVGGSIIDLTERAAQNDQLSCLYPGGGGFRFTEEVDWPADWGALADGAAAVAFAGEAIAIDADEDARPLVITVGYELRDDERFVRVVSTITNTGDEPIEATAVDGVRADGDDFRVGHVDEIRLWWTHDEHWGQAYGLQAESADRIAYALRATDRRRPRQIVYPTVAGDQATTTLAPGESLTWRRRVFPAVDAPKVRAMAYDHCGVPCRELKVKIVDGAIEPVAGAEIRLISTPPGGADGERVSLGVGRTDENGEYAFRAPEGDYVIRFRAQGHETVQTPCSIGPDGGIGRLIVSTPSYVEGAITDSAGSPIPAKVQIIGVGETRDPNFGPDSGVRGVGNLQYTPDGRFRVKVFPGEYRWIASYGPEHDAAEGRFKVRRGDTARVVASLPRSVDTTGWLSSELHSHSSPSGDNTASQRGRVLNLLCDHLEFCPCTEHQRIDVYDEHLAHFDAAHRMLTCPGIELTGQPLPLNHQNAFPLKHAPHIQHGGAPSTDVDPVAQVERLAGWDNGSEKVVQINHSNIAQTVGDRDLDGEPDEGFERMYLFTDVIEVDPPGLIFEPLGEPGERDSGVGFGGAEGRGNEMINWLQMLNLGYRVTAVVNTDAHYNNHGSGWLRNWVRSSTDDPAEASVAELIHEFEHGHVVMSNGPFLMVEATGGGSSTAIPGDDLAADAGRARFRVVIRCPNWLEVNRLQLFLNGRPVEQHNYTVRSHGEWFSPGPEVFDRTIELELDEDTHVVVACAGEDRQLGVIYGERFGQAMPVAVSNPIFVDTDGDADGDGIVFEANRDGLGIPLPTPDDFKPSHGHDHHNHTH